MEVEVVEVLVEVDVDVDDVEEVVEVLVEVDVVVLVVVCSGANVVSAVPLSLYTGRFWEFKQDTLLHIL